MHFSVWDKWLMIDRARECNWLATVENNMRSKAEVDNNSDGDGKMRIVRQVSEMQSLMSVIVTNQLTKYWFPKISCAICASLTAVSKGVEFGFTSQLTYSLKHGYEEIEVTDIDISWIGI